MKKLFAAAALVTALAFTGCPTEDEGGNSGDDKTTLTISNQSFVEITGVIWGNVLFANNTYENSIKSGTFVTQDVQAGGGYIFFKRKTGQIVARTQEMIIIEEKQKADFTFTGNTVIVEVHNSGNSGTLDALQSTVVWFDDAEGELQPYYESRSFVGYYRNKDSDLRYPSESSAYFNVYEHNECHPPKNGKKSIAVGGTNTALLRIKISLTRNARLSFWYANKIDYDNENTHFTIFAVNGEVQRTWTTDINWSKMEIDLLAGENDLVWEKKDGYYKSPRVSYTNWYLYLSLDDILVYYTE